MVQLCLMVHAEADNQWKDKGLGNSAVPVGCHPPHVDNHPPHIDNHAPHVDNYPPHVDNYAPHVDDHAPHVDNHAPHVDNDRNFMINAHTMQGADESLVGVSPNLTAKIG